MGGRPVLALNIVTFPQCKDMEILAEILKGGADKVKEAGAIIVGGHTVDDDEPKYGLSVMGIIHPSRILSNSNAKEGDVLILTKPIGTGIINTAIKGEIAGKDEIAEAVKYMSMLNKYAAEIAEKYPINSCTDITGFGLAGHAYEMAKGSNVTIRILSSNIKYINGAVEYAKMGLIPAGTYRNRNYLKDKYKFNAKEEYILDLVFDPQTSGGLLFSLPEKEANKLLNELNDNGIDAFIVGYVERLCEYYIIID